MQVQGTTIRFLRGKKSTLQTNFEQKSLHGGKVCIFTPNV